MNIGDLVKELAKEGLTLQNLASIKEQTVGGFIQASCHGTGITLPPVCDQVVSLRLATAAEGVLDLKKVRVFSFIFFVHFLVPFLVPFLVHFLIIFCSIFDHFLLRFVTAAEGDLDLKKINFNNSN